MPSARRATWGFLSPFLTMYDFYPRPPRGGRLVRTSTAVVADVFLSTPSARRATGRIHRLDCDDEIFLSTPSARRATAIDEVDGVDSWEFLSTPSARRATDGGVYLPQNTEIFLSTPSARRATRAFHR